MNDFLNRVISKQITMERFNLDNFQDLGDVKIVIKETDGILQKVIHILCYKHYEIDDYSITVLTNSGHTAYYDNCGKSWRIEPSSAEIDPPVAWCEIPKYEGKNDRRRRKNLYVL